MPRRERTCYGCRHLLQSGSGVNACLRFDYDGPFQGTILQDDPPEPLYEDCYEPQDSQPAHGRAGTKQMSAAISTAERIARRAHVGQTEQSTGDDYIKHIERVVALTENEEAKPVAWLHDVIEDTMWTATGLLAAGIALRIVEAVLVVTRDKERESYAEYIQRVKDSGDELALAVKLADLKDHLRPGCPARLRPRYEKAWKVLTT